MTYVEDSIAMKHLPGRFCPGGRGFQRLFLKIRSKSSLQIYGRELVCFAAGQFGTQRLTRSLKIQQTYTERKAIARNASGPKSLRSFFGASPYSLSVLRFALSDCRVPQLDCALSALRCSTCCWQWRSCWRGSAAETDLGLASRRVCLKDVDKGGLGL